ncbi:hypothetical protein LCGC14_2422520, partial [marine sediment metagenome]
MAFIGIFESPSVRLTRLRSALESTAQDVGDTATQLVDLEARRRAMEDNLRRFREVEQQQNLQFPQPPRQPGIPSLIEDVFRQTGRVAGGPGTEDAFLPENVGGLAPPIPSQLLGERERQAELFRRLIAQGVDPEEAEQRVLGGETFTRGETVTPEGQLRLSQGLDLRPQDTTAPGTTQDVVGQLPFGVQELERARERFTAPIAALGLQGVESPIGSAVPVVPPAKAIQAIAGPAAEALGGVDGGIQLEAVRLGLKGLEATLPRARTLDEAFEGGIVDPFAAARGSEEEIAKAQAVLEEAGLPRALAAEVLFDPLNLLPGVGFTKVDDVARLGRLVLRATRAVPEARAAAVATLRESGQFRRLLRTVSEEAGGGPPLRGGEPVNPHIAKADPSGPPPREPPTGKPTAPSPDDPQFASLQEVSIKGEPPDQTLLRRHQGAIDTAAREAQIEVTDGNRLLRDAEMGQGFRGTVVPKAGQTDEFDEMY